MKVKNKIMVFSIFLFFIVVSSGIVFAEDTMPLVENGEVSGDVEVSSVNPFTSTNGELTYEIPENVSEIKSANVVVSSYSGSGAPTYGLTTNISLKTNQGIDVLEYANLTYPDSTASDPVVYSITNVTSKQYSDYQSLIDITDKVKSLSGGDSITISVNNTALDGYSFDGRIKLIALIFAYDDNDNDKITYWLNVGQAWTKGTLTTIFNTKDSVDDYDDVTLESIALSSSDATYMLNGELLLEPTQVTGSYYIYDIWNITENFQLSNNTNFTYTSSKASTYASYKSAIQLLKITSFEKYFISGSITPQYKDTVFAGANNTLTIDIVNGNKDFNGSVQLLIGDTEIASEDLEMSAGSGARFTLIDPTIRPVNETTVNGANNTKVTYTINILDYEGNILNSTNATYNVLYNGNLGKDLAYPASNATVERIYVIAGDVLIISQDSSAYAGTGITNRESVFEVSECELVEGLLYVSYNWDKIAEGDYNSWNITFNNQTIVPIASYRDQSNLGTYGKYGYGLLVYNVSDLIIAGDNVLVINKTSGGCAVYPSALVLLTDNNESDTYKMVYIAENADLLSKPVNIESGSYTFMDVLTENMIKSNLVVFAAGAQLGEGNVYVNDNVYEDVWNGTSSTLSFCDFDITNLTSENNVVYFQSTGSTILALQDILVVEYQKTTPELNLTSEDVTVGQDVVVNVELSENVTGNVSMNDVSVELGDSKATFVVSDLTAGEYNFTVYYLGDSKYNPTNATITVNVLENKSVNLTAPDVEKYYGGSERFNVYLTTLNGTPINNESVSILINGVTYNKVTDDNGTISIALGLNSGDYDVTVKFNGTDDYDGAEINSSVVIKSTIDGSDVTKIFRNGTQYYATFVDSEGSPLANGTTVEFNINGVKYQRQTNENATARLNINLAPGEYIITATNPKNGEMASNNITVLANLVANDLTKYYKNDSQYYVQVLGEDGNPVGANETVIFNINGVFYERQTNENGTARLNINLAPGDYVITATYNGCNIANNISVLPILNASDISMSYRDGTQFKATLLNGTGSPYAGQIVTFNINGVFYNRTTDSEGVAALNINLMSGEYIITSTYNGCNIANTITIKG